MDDQDRTKPLPTTESADEHHERVRAAFDDLGTKLGDRVSPEARATVESLREAALEKDAESVRGHLDALKEKHGWLWEELTAHPRVAALVNELALFGL
jgi:hypothetical protein